MLIRSLRPVFHFEFSEDGGGLPEPQGAPESAGSPEASTQAPQAAGADSGAFPGGWTGPSEDEWYEVQATLRAIAERLGQTPQPGAGLDQGSTGFEWDPLSDDAGEQLLNLLSQRDEMLLQRIQEMLGPVVAHTREELTKEAEQRAMDVLADIEAREGEFKSEQGRAIARVLADSYFPQAAERFGNTPRAAEYALQQAAAALRSYEAAVAERVLNEYKASLKSVAGAPSEPGAGATGSGEVPEEAETEAEAVARLFGTQVAA